MSEPAGRSQFLDGLGAARAPAPWVPAPGSGFVGREAERAALCDALGRLRLVSLLGPGGVGKTRLALEVGRDRERTLGDPPVVVELGTLGEAALVTDAVAGALGLTPAGSGTEELVGALGDRTCLLVLDGCEAVAPQAARLVQVLLDECPHVRVLATSRVALGVTGEWRFAVLPLSVPGPGAMDVETLLAFEAPRLFVERARAVHPRLSLDEEAARAVAAICRRVDGFPLALELAAARVGVLGLSELAAALDDGLGLLDDGEGWPSGAEPDGLRRRRSMRAALDWSMEQLPCAEADVLARLAVCAGGAGFSALATSLPDPASRHAVAEGISGLTERALVVREDQAGQARFRVLEIVGEAARARLETDGRLQAYLDWHREWCVALARGAEADLIAGPRLRRRLEALVPEEENIRLALRRSLDAGHTEAAATLGAELWRFWELRGRLAEGRRWVEACLAGRPPGHLRARLLDGLGMLAWRQADYEAAQAAMTESLGLVVAAGDEAGTARLRNHLGLVRAFVGDVAGARELFVRSLEGHRALGQRVEAALVTANLALMAADAGDLGEARSLAEEALAVQRAEGDDHGAAISMLHLGLICALEGRLGKAADALMEAAADLDVLGDRRSLAYALVALGGAVAADHPGPALQVAGAGATLCDSLGVCLPRRWQETADDFLACAWEALGADAPGQFRSGRALAPAEALDVVAAALARPAGAGPSAPWARVEVLGPFRVEAQVHPNRREVASFQPRAAQVVELLAISGGAKHVDNLIEALWPEVEPDVGRRRLRNVLARVAEAAGPLVVRRGETVAFAPGVECDVTVFEAEARRARAALSAGEPHGAALARSALARYGGDLLSDDPYQPWAAAPRERLRLQRLGLLDSLAADAAARGDTDEAVELLAAAIEADPTDEARYVRSARLLHEAGRSGAALAIVARARQVAGALDVRPSPALAALEVELRV